MVDANEAKGEEAGSSSPLTPPPPLTPPHQDIRSAEDNPLVAPFPSHSFNRSIPEPYPETPCPSREMDPPPPRRSSNSRPLRRVHATVPESALVHSSAPHAGPGSRSAAHDVRSYTPNAPLGTPLGSAIELQTPFAGEVNPFEGLNNVTARTRFTRENFNSTGMGLAYMSSQFIGANVHPPSGGANSPLQFNNANAPLEFNNQGSIIDPGFVIDDEIGSMNTLDAASGAEDIDHVKKQGDIFYLHREQEANYRAYGDDSAESQEHLRRLAVISSIAESNTQSEIKKGKKKMAKGTEKVAPPPPEVPIVPMAKLAISHLKRLKDSKKKGKNGDDGGKSKCHFCAHQDDYGVTDSKVWMKVDAFRRWCGACHYTVQHFQREIEASDPSFEAPPDVFDNAEAELEATDPLPELPPNSYISLIDKSDITPHMRIMFCRGLAAKYALVDPWQARICDECYEQKLAIIKHRHLEWSDVIKGQKPQEDRSHLTRCMVCTSIAVKRCAGCPLRLCAGCHSILVGSCKSYLNNLFYYYGRDHIRNDAFLLRGDGGGYQRV